MNVQQFRETIAAHPDHALRIEHTGGALAEHFHVTEVGCVAKDFVDCGGVRRSEVRCVLQTLVAGDFDHRLSSTKLAKIVSLVDQLDLPADAPVEVEHQERSVSIDMVEQIVACEGVLTIRLAPKQTACLAEDACGITPLGPDLTVVGGSCDPSSGCCDR